MEGIVETFLQKQQLPENEAPTWRMMSDVGLEVMLVRIPMVIGSDPVYK